MAEQGGLNTMVNFFADSTQGNPMLGSGLKFSGDIMQDMYENDVPDTHEGLMFIALAYISCTFPTSTVSWSITDWTEISSTVKFPRTYTPAMAEGIVARGDSNSNGHLPTWTPNNSTADECGKYNKENIDECPDSENRVSFNTVYKGRYDWKQFFLDLVNAYQVSGLTEGHVSSYMKWLKVQNIEGVYISKNFGKLTGGIPKISDINGLRAVLRKGKWTEYRSTFATITGILARMLDEMPEKYVGVFSQPTITLIRDAQTNSHNEDDFRKIPTIALAYAYCWSQVTEMGIDGLWSGKRAYEDLSYNLRSSMMEYCKAAKAEVKIWKAGAFSGQLPAALRDV